MSETNKGAGRTGNDSGVPQGVNYLLAIGIDNYKKINRLYNCRLDVEALVKLLHDKYQFHPGHTTILLDGEATRSRIYKELDKLVDKVTPQDNLLLYFSGHGQYYKQLDEGYWIPVEGDPENGFNDYIPNVYFQKYLKSIKAHHFLVIADSCFSGTFFAEKNIQTGTQDEKFPSRWVLTSGRTELVSDGKPGEHSPFAKNILHFLEKNTSPALPLTRLIDYVKETTVANARQIPRGEPIADTGHKGGQFFFHLKRDEGRDWAAAQKLDTAEGYRNFLTIFPTGAHAEEASWRFACKENTIQAYWGFLEKHPRNVNAPEAELRILALEDDRDWHYALRMDSLLAFRKYLQTHEKGKYRKEAEDRIQALLGRTSSEPLLPKPKPVPLPKKERKVKPTLSRDQIKRILLIGLPILIVGMIAIWLNTRPASEPTHWTCIKEYDDCLKVVTPDGLCYFVRKGEKWGYVNDKGEVLMAPRFEAMDSFNTYGLAMVMENGKYGWMNMQGDLIIPVVYDSAGIFAEGKAIVYKKDAALSIDTLGNELPKEKPKTSPPASTASTQQEPEKTVAEPAQKTKPPPPKPALPLPEMVEVRGGTFTMGCTPEQGSDCGGDETPRQVTISTFEIAKHEVTQALWKAVMGENPSYFKDCDQCPVERVIWNDVQEFLKKLNQLAPGSNYRLPTEAEWEYAARGGQKNKKYKYAGGKSMNEVGWYSENSGRKTHVVGTKAPNELGIFDMSGNVWEWCQDQRGSFRVIRGGSWYDVAGYCRVSGRVSADPDSWDYGFGFRLSRTP